VRVWWSALCSLVPCVGLAAGIAFGGDPVVVTDLLSTVLAHLGFVGLPSLVAILAARSTFMRLAATLLMTGVAVFAGVQVATIDDGQAGMAVIYVPLVAFPLAGAVRVGRAVEARLLGRLD
jgi:hypothetical protein